MKTTSLFLISFFLFGCSKKNTVTENADKTPADTSNIVGTGNTADSIQPIWGYRFQIIGDFDGNGIKDTLNEHFYSSRDKKETNKYYSGINDQFRLYDSVFARECVSYFLCNDSKFDTVPVSGIFGPLWMKNEGDLDKDGCDDISFVESLPQQSSMNHCMIISFKKGKWEEIYRFAVYEWEFPPLPDAGKTYGLFGMDGSYTTANNDSINQLLQEQFDAFPGLIKKLRSGNVEISTRTPELNDTILKLDLSKHPDVYN